MRLLKILLAIVFLLIAGVTTLHFVQPKWLSRPYAWLGNLGILSSPAPIDLVPDSPRLLSVLSLASLRQSTYEDVASGFSQALPDLKKLRTFENDQFKKLSTLTGEPRFQQQISPVDDLKSLEKTLKNKEALQQLQTSVVIGLLHDPKVNFNILDKTSAIDAYPAFIILKSPVGLPLLAPLMAPETMKDVLVSIIENQVKSLGGKTDASTQSLITLLDAIKFEGDWSGGFPVVKATHPLVEKFPLYFTATDTSTIVASTNHELLSEILDQVTGHRTRTVTKELVRAAKNRTLYVTFDADAAIKSLGPTGQMVKMMTGSLQRLEFICDVANNIMVSLNGIFDDKKDAEAGKTKITPGLEKIKAEPTLDWLNPKVTVKGKILSASHSMPFGQLISRIQNSIKEKIGKTEEQWKLVAGVEQYATKYKMRNLKFEGNPEHFGVEEAGDFKFNFNMEKSDNPVVSDMALTDKSIQPQLVGLPPGCSGYNLEFQLMGKPINKGKGKSKAAKFETLKTSPMYSKKPAAMKWSLPTKEASLAAYVVDSPKTYSELKLHILSDKPQAGMPCRLDYAPFVLTQ